MSEHEPVEVPKRTVVVGVDGSDASRCALRHTALVAAAMQAQVVTVFVRRLAPLVASPTAGEAVAVLADSLDELETSIRDSTKEILDDVGVSWVFEARHGDPAHQIIASAHEHEAAIVVVGSTIHGAVASVLLSSVANHLLHHCDVSVAVIRPDRPVPS